MTAAFAELERNLIAERTTTALQHKKAQGEVYSPIPFGYDRARDRLETNTEEQEVVQDIRAWRREGLSYHSIARRLNEAQVPTKRGRAWYPATIHYLCGNTLYQEAA
jgi:site-specific DNA recombinase